MGKDYQVLLDGIFEHSKLPSIIICDDTVIENSSFKELSIHPDLKRALILKYMIKKSEGGEEINGVYYGVNVIRFAVYTIIEFYPKSSVDKLIKDPELIKYLMCFFAKLRSEIYGIAEKTDALQEIFSDYLDKYEDASLTLKHIDNELNSIMSIILNPEQIVYLTSDNCTGSIINVTRVVSELARNFVACHSDIDVYVNTEEIYMTKINRSAFEVLISNFVERVYNGIDKPSNIDFIINKVDEEIKVQVKADFQPKIKSENKKLDGRKSVDDFFFQYVLDIFCSKFDAKACMVEDRFFEISLPATPFYEVDFHSSVKFIPEPDRFAPIVVKTKNRYR